MSVEPAKDKVVFTREFPASQHPDICVRTAEDFATGLVVAVNDLLAGKITAEIFGHSYQKFCVERLRAFKAEIEEVGRR